jgi:23S rRNA (cytosine1962-C5)-methyltransferase
MRVTPRAERELRDGYPWVFAAAVVAQSDEGAAGDLTVVFDRRGRFLAVGIYDPRASIRVRVLQHSEPAVIDGAWFQARLQAAAEVRAPLRRAPDARKTTGYRLVHGENDGLPGMVIDWYEGTAVFKLYTGAWLPHLEDVLAALSAVQRPERVVLRFGRAVLEHRHDAHGLVDGQVLSGEALSGPLLFCENGLRFEADPLRGHKTGFYFDQRDNRSRVEGLAAGKRVLNLFAYTGAFSVYAARGAAQHAVSVDVSKPALEAAQRNLERNRGHPAIASCVHQTVAADAFDLLEKMHHDGGRFAMVIADPPAFANRRSQVEKALAAYRRLTRLSLGVLQAGGILVQASCSRQVSAQAFFTSVHQAARRAGRPLQEIARTGHALDHPVTFREGAYLKCLFARAS